MDLLRFLERISEEIVDALRGQRYGHALFVEALHHFLRQIRQTGIIAAGEAHERDFVIAGGVDQLFGQLEQAIHRAFAHGAIDHAGLTEAAAARAAAENFEHDAVVDDLSVGYDELLGIIGGGEIVHHGLEAHLGRAGAGLGRDRLERAVLIVGDVIERGNVNALDAHDHLEKFLAGRAALLPLFVNVDVFVRVAFAVAQREKIDERRERLGIIGAGAAAHDERAVRTIGSAQRDAGQIERGQYVGIAHFILKRNAQYVELLNRRAGFDREQRNIVCAHLLFHVDPRRKDALAPGVVALVDGMIEDLHAQMGHPHLIGIRKQEGIAHIHVRGVLHDGTELAADIADGLRNLHHQGIDFIRKRQGFYSSLRHNHPLNFITNRAAGQPPNEKNKPTFAELQYLRLKREHRLTIIEATGNKAGEYNAHF